MPQFTPPPHGRGRRGQVTREPIRIEAPHGRRETPAPDAAVERLRDSLGSGAIKRAVLLGRENGRSVPRLSD